MASTVTLPRGVPREDGLHRHAELRSLTGEDEAWLLDAADEGILAERVTALLARLVTRLGPPGPVTAEHVRGLAVGDREALLLHARRLTFGERIPCVLACPSCREALDVELRAQDLLLPPYADAAPAHELRFEEEGRAWTARFRLPTGEDHEEAARAARRDPDEGTRTLVDRCLASIEVDGAPTAERPASLAERLGARIAALDPQAELLFEMACPACGTVSHALFDPASYLLAELSARARRVYHEVHLLARHYHWSERDILAMPPRRRATYLRLLDEHSAPGGLA